MTRTRDAAARSALACGYWSCDSCRLLLEAQWRRTGRVACPRCGAAVHPRKPDSIARTWALVIAAAVFYVPANTLPVMSSSMLGDETTATIFGGIVLLFQHGDWLLGLVIFSASILVPVLKLVILVFLLLSVQLRMRGRPRERLQLYRLIEVSGRWSMVDVYVVAVLVALVKMGRIAYVEAENGVVFFAAVVVITMLAAQSFDPRLIWDVRDARQEPKYARR